MARTTYYDPQSYISATVDEYGIIVAIEKQDPPASNGKALKPAATIRMRIDGTPHTIASDASVGPGMAVGGVTRGLFQLVRLRGRRVNLMLLQGRIIGMWGGKACAGAAVVDRLDLTDDEERLDGDTLYVGAFGLTLIMTRLYEASTRPSGRAMHDRLSDLFAGAALFTEMMAATCRAGIDQSGFGGEADMYIAAAHRQLAWQPSGPVTLTVESA